MKNLTFVWNNNSSNLICQNSEYQDFQLHLEFLWSYFHQANYVQNNFCTSSGGILSSNRKDTITCSLCNLSIAKREPHEESILTKFTFFQNKKYIFVADDDFHKLLHYNINYYIQLLNFTIYCQVHIIIIEQHKLHS